MIVSAAVLIAVLATSVLSGIVGMAGGMILMAVLTLLASVPAAMMLHGVTQTGSNGARAWFLRAHIRWRVLPPYLLGVALCVGVFGLFAFVPERGLVLILIGLFPWLGRIVPAIERLDVERAGPAMLCGAVVTAAQLLAGASGPLLDVFFLRSALTRHQIVATKAVTQTLGHLTKLGYYGTLLLAAGSAATVTDEFPVLLFVAVVPVALLGTRLGTRILDRLDEAQFRDASQRIILAIGAACTITGVWELLR